MPVPAPAPHLLPMRLFPLSGEHKVPANSVGFRRAAMANPAAEAADPRQVFIGTWPLAGDKHPLDLRLPDLVSLRTSDPSNPSAPYHLRPPLLVGGWGSFQRSFAWGRAESRRGAFAGCLRGCTRDQAGRPASPSALHCMSAPSPVGCQLPPGSYGPIYPGSAPPTPNLLSVTN